MRHRGHVNYAGFRSIAVTFGILLLIILPAAAQSPVTIRLDSEGHFRVDGWNDAAKFGSKQWPRLFVVEVDTPAVPPLLGSYSLVQGSLLFIPRYPLQAGLRYRATLKIPNRTPLIESFSLPKPDTVPTTVVEHVYPSSSVLPENQLKFYIHFSAPMSRGEAYKHVHLLDETGKPVTLPFLELTEELWDRKALRFTLFFDPGRIKSGLVPHNEMGLAIRDGRKYTLVIDREWQDGEGKPLKESYRKSFSAGPAERKRLDPSTWRIVAPKAGTTDPVSVEFPKPMDRALLERELEIMDESGNPVNGSIDIDRYETRWRLTPESPWKAVTYSVRVGTILADLAGNMVDHPFEIDVFENVDQQLTHQTHSLSFTVR
jgi:hypothetical protein